MFGILDSKIEIYRCNNSENSIEDLDLEDND